MTRASRLSAAAVSIPFVYSDEVWTGIEYQVAAHLTFEGFTDEALTVVTAACDRHAGGNRNPWNEVECGSHYARSLASCGMLELTVLGGELHLTDLRLHGRSLRPEHRLETTIGAGAVARFPIDATDSE